MKSSLSCGCDHLDQRAAFYSRFVEIFRPQVLLYNNRAQLYSVEQWAGFKFWEHKMSISLYVMDFNWDKCTGGAHIDQLTSSSNCTALTVQCPGHKLSPPKTRPNCSKVAKALNNQPEYNCFSPPPVVPHRQKMDTQVRVMIRLGVALQVRKTLTLMGFCLKE